MRIFTSLIICLFIVFQAAAQRELGSWQDYLSFINARKVAVTGDKVYCATDGGLFYYDLQDNSINKISGLSEFGSATMGYNSQNSTLLLAYSNCNVDILVDGEVYNLSDIERKTTTAEKSINNITFNDTEAYLSCGFGIVAVNLDKKEIKDTYYIGDDGAPLSVYDVEFFENSIYAATEEGILVAPAEGANLLDYSSWVKMENVPNVDSKFTQLASHSGSLIANYSPGESQSDEMYIFDGTDWQTYYSSLSNVYDMQADGSYLTVSAGDKTVLFDESHNVIGLINSYQLSGENVSSVFSRSACVSSDGSVWIADYTNGLIRLSGSTFEALYPAGPMDNEVFFLCSSNSDVWVAPGGRTDAWNNSFMAPRFQRCRSGEWTNFSKTEYTELNDFFDIVCLAVDPSDDNHIFVGSWGGGVLEFLNDEFVQRYTNLNSPLESALPQQPDEPYVRIGGLDFDSGGNLWITNTSTAGNNLHKLSPSGEWESFSMSEVLDKSIGQLVVTENDDKWVLVPRGYDAYVVNDSGSEMEKLLVTTYFTNGEVEEYVRMNDVYSIAEDLDGEIWIGSSKGVAVYSSPQRVWDSDSFYGTQPGLDLDDGLYNPLLSTETVTAIAVDGANRKWLGTSGSGVYLISENGDEEIEHFTEDNSSLLSNTITAIAINQNTGEVYFGTDKGLISYQGEASGGNDTYDDVYVYPNPVRETYDGLVTITGLIENTDIKITDISGNLVYKTTSLGGSATWDGNNLNGNRVKTGVYLVFCNDEYGEETHITKLLFIH